MAEHKNSKIIHQKCASYQMGQFFDTCFQVTEQSDSKLLISILYDNDKVLFSKVIKLK